MCTYRQVAANNSEFKDFADLDVDDLAAKYNDDDSIATFDSKHDDNGEEKQDSGDDHFNDNPENDDVEDCIQKKTFLSHMFRLTQRQRWVETLARR
jgi:hypothetical protein